MSVPYVSVPVQAVPSRLFAAPGPAVEPERPAIDWRTWRPPAGRLPYWPPTCGHCGAYAPDHLLTCTRPEDGGR